MSHAGAHTYWNPPGLLGCLVEDNNEVEGILEMIMGFGLGVGGMEN